ncbi:hypothetical protein C2845_PM12G15260 [Panicum miliaceum]|uniref:Uncharacterized protein n=1 Tax=Panicum miliaceum TaxID=4540 RepID=A0A3L6QBU6_PANMI|nr:hypothetical protein C2845_PM12G15260 [Panicum miliaceum]
MAGVECEPKVTHSKRKAESLSAEECSLEERASKRIDCSEAEKGPAAPVVAGGEGEEAPAKKMWRLPREEVNGILSQSNEPVDPEIRALKRANPSLVPSPEEKDEYMAWVRREYASKGFVEVDYVYFGQRAEAIRLSNEARVEVFKDYDLSSDSEDDYAWKLVKRKELLGTKELKTPTFNWEELDLSKVEDNGFNVPFTESLIWNASLTVLQANSIKSAGLCHENWAFT